MRCPAGSAFWLTRSGALNDLPPLNETAEYALMVAVGGGITGGVPPGVNEDVVLHTTPRSPVGPNSIHGLNAFGAVITAGPVPLAGVVGGVHVEVVARGHHDRESTAVGGIGGNPGMGLVVTRLR